MADITIDNPESMGSLQTVVTPVNDRLDFVMIDPPPHVMYELRYPPGTDILTFTLPATRGTAGQVLSVDGSGHLVWVDMPRLNTWDAFGLLYTLVLLAVLWTVWRPLKRGV